MQFTTETREYLTWNFIPFLHEEVDVRADDFLRIKFLGCIDNKIFLLMVLRFAHLKRESEADDNSNINNSNNNNSNYSNNDNNK